MSLKAKHRREIRDLLRVLYDDKAWQPRHTDSLLGIVRAARSDVADEVEKRIAQDYAAHRQEQIILRRQQRDALRDVEHLREDLKGLHEKVSTVLETLLDLPLAKASIRDEHGNVVGFDPLLIDDKTAKVALSATEKILKVTGALVPPKIELEVNSGSAFDLLDAVEVEEAEEAE